MKNRLDVFYVVAEKRSFTQAAQILYISQPAVSAAIKGLEFEYGLPLFSRAGGHVELTEAGLTLFGYVKQIKSLESKALAEVSALKGDLSGRLAIGASTTIAQYVLPRFLSELMATLPSVSLVVTAQKTEHVAQLLHRAEVDVAVVEGSLKGSEFNISVWMPDELRLYVAPHHTWANKQIKFDELIKAPLFMREPGSGHHQIQEECFRSRDVELADLNIIMELGSTEGIKLGVEAGLGCAFLSDWSCKKERALGTLAPVTVEDFQINRNFYIVQTKDSESNAIVQRFVTFLHKVNPKLKPKV